MRFKKWARAAKTPPPDANSPSRPFRCPNRRRCAPAFFQTSGGQRPARTSLATPCFFTRSGELRLAGPNLARREWTFSTPSRTTTKFFACFVTSRFRTASPLGAAPFTEATHSTPTPARAPARIALAARPRARPSARQSLSTRSLEFFRQPSPPQPPESPSRHFFQSQHPKAKPPRPPTAPPLLDPARAFNS